MSVTIAFPIVLFTRKATPHFTKAIAVDYCYTY